MAGETAFISDKLSEALDISRAIEMAILGSSTIDPVERKALSRIAEMLATELLDISQGMEVQRRAEKGGK